MYIFFSSLPLFGGPGLMELAIIVGAIVLLFGATKLPKLGKGLGEGIRNFKSGLKGENQTDRVDTSKTKEELDQSVTDGN